MNVSSTQCDFTTRIFSPYGHYTGWVKALLGDQSSDWVTSEEFIHDSESEDHPADLTPPPISASFLITYFPTVMLNNTQQRSVFLPFISPLSLSPSAIIGPPNVTLLSVGTAIEVSIKDPEFAVSKLKEVFAPAAYSVTYWKDGEMEQVT